MQEWQRKYNEDLARWCPGDADELVRLRAALLNIQALAERGSPIDNAKLATMCRHALSNCETATIDSVPSCGQENDYRRAQTNGERK